MLSGSTLNQLTNITSLRKYVVVSFLNSASITLPADGKTRVYEIEAQVVNYLQRLGMKETEIFGLALLIDDEFVFIDGENKLSKYASRQWKISTNGLDNEGNPLLKFHFRVKYYLSSSVFIRDQVSRLHYYLQLRENVLIYDQDLQEDEILGLVALALQSDVGDYNPNIHSGQYFDPSQYFPQWILSQMGISFVLDRIPNFHRKLKALSTSDAQSRFIQEASLGNSPHNVHFYQLRKKKHDPSTQVAVSISDKGIGIYEEERINNKKSKKLLQSFHWSNIEDLSFDKKKFEIRASCYSGKLTFYTSSDEKSKLLLQLCRLTHQFSRNLKWQSSGSVRLSSHDFGEELELRSSAGQSLESGEASVQRSLSTSLAPGILSSDQDEDINTSMLRYSPSGNADNSSLNWEAHSKLDSSYFDRTSSIHSSSSQHSASTVRSRYSLVPSRHRHELALGAQLADLSLAPDLPDLADLPSMAARGDEATEGAHHTHSKSHNCCSTCCDDNASLVSEEADGEEENSIKSSCRCGSCSYCLHPSLPNKFENMGLFLSYENSSKPSQRMFPLMFTDSDSLVAQPDLDDILGSTYDFSEEDLSQLDNNDDYVEFYKGGVRYYEHQSSVHGNEDELKHALDSLNLSNNSKENKNAQGEFLSQQALSNKNFSPVKEEQTLDYSVESAQNILASSYSVHKNETTLARLMGREDSKCKKRIMQPFPVSMSKVTTVTPVSIASSRFNLASACPNIKENINESSLPTHEAIVTFSNSTEAPAKFITSKPRIAVLTAQTQLASTTAPSFTSVPLARGNIHTLPQVQHRTKPNDIQSLQREMLPNPKPLSLLSSFTKEELENSADGYPTNHFTNQLPVIRANNYLDVHASSNLNKERLRTHPEQLPSKNPRSLFLKNQKKKLHRESIQNKHQLEQLHKQLLNETVYQPAAYAQGVGVPLKPSPKYTRCHSSKVLSEFPSTCFEAHSVFKNDSQFHPPIVYPCHLPQQQCYHFQHHSEQNELEGSHQNKLCHPSNRNILQNPNLPLIYPGHDNSFCPTDQTNSGNAEILSPYQHTVDSGIYPFSNQPALSATVYTNQVTQSQIEQFKAQLNSDTDYVIYPHKDPAISKQEYMDAKQSQIIASNAQKQGINCDFVGLEQLPPPYKSSKSCSLYRSAPNVAGSFSASTILTSYPSYQSLASQGSTHQPGSSSGYSSMARGRYFSQQSLASFSSAPSTYSASTQSLTGSFDPYVDAPSIPKSPPAVVRVRSDESILSSNGGLTEMDSYLGSLRSPHVPSRPPPLPPYRSKEALDNCRNKRKSYTSSKGISSCRSRSRQTSVTLQQVRERGVQLEVPLLTALCSDSSLFAQRNVYSAPKGSKHSKSSKSSRDSSKTSSTSEMSEFSKASEMSITTTADKVDSSTCRYYLTGVYTTNQVPALQRSSKSSKSTNGLHHHPKVRSKNCSRHQVTSEFHKDSCQKLKQCKSSTDNKE